jgi:hypothetical protein
MIAGTRLTQVSGLSGVSAGVMMQAIGTGVTAGDALVNYSGLPTATAGVHLMTDVAGGNWLFVARKRHRR